MPTTTPTGTTSVLGPTLTSESGDLGPVVLAVCWIESGIAAIFLGLRLYVKLTAHRKLYWDDFLLIASWVLLVAFSGTAIYGVQWGLGQHDARNKYGDGGRHLQLTVVIATTFSVLGAALSKTSFAITLLRLTKGIMRKVVWFAIISMNIILVFNVILQFIRCQPTWAAWNSGTGGTCWSRGVITYYSVAAAAYSATMDILLAMVPWSVIMRLKMHLKEKIGVAICMSLGIVAATTSIMRAIYIPAIYAEDYTWDESSLFVWTATEVATTIIAASIPVLRPLLRSFVNSTQRKDGRTGVTNTFKTGTYVCSAVGRAQSYRRMDGEGNSQKAGGSGHLDDISEDGERSPDLVSTSSKSFDHGRDHDGILKTETVQVQYAMKTWDAKEDDHAENLGLGFELDEVPPSHLRSTSR